MARPTLELSWRERFEAWLLTGPAGRVYSLGRDLVSAAPMLGRYWTGRIRRRVRGEPPTD